VHRLAADPPYLVGQGRRPEDEHRRPDRHALRQDARGGLRARDDLRRLGRDAEAGEPFRHERRWREALLVT
jgi:hypothetical protein